MRPHQQRTREPIEEMRVKRVAESPHSCETDQSHLCNRLRFFGQMIRVRSELHISLVNGNPWKESPNWVRTISKGLHSLASGLWMRKMFSLWEREKRRACVKVQEWLREKEKQQGGGRNAEKEQEDDELEKEGETLVPIASAHGVGQCQLSEDQKKILWRVSLSHGFGGGKKGEQRAAAPWPRWHKEMFEAGQIETKTNCQLPKVARLLENYLKNPLQTVLCIIYSLFFNFFKF